jgi:uroporphyrinogen decarboxylase
LRGIKTDRPARGEIFIAPELIEKFSCADLESILARLNSDLAVLPIEDSHWARPSLDVLIEAGYFVFGLIQGPLTLLIHELGWHVTSRLLLKNPQDARRIMQKLANAAAQKVNAGLEAGCDGVVIADDLAGSQGPMVSPALLRECYFPALGNLIRETGSDNNPHIFHSDGDITDLVVPLMEAGCRGIHGLQPSAGIGPALFAGEDFRDQVYWGNFEYECDGRLKSKEEVEAEIPILLDSWADFPGYIFGSSGGLYGELPPETIKAAYLHSAWNETIRHE